MAMFNSMFTSMNYRFISPYITQKYPPDLPIHPTATALFEWPKRTRPGEIAASFRSFAALRVDGTLLTWGSADCGGDCEAVQEQWLGLHPGTLWIPLPQEYQVGL